MYFRFASAIAPVTVEDVTDRVPMDTTAGSGIVVSPAVVVVCVYCVPIYCKLVRSIEVIAADDAIVSPPVITFKSGRFKVVSG